MKILITNLIAVLISISAYSQTILNGKVIAVADGDTFTMLTEGKKGVESIALDLGYANASAFINMFKLWMVYTPDQFAKK